MINDPTANELASVIRDDLQEAVKIALIHRARDTCHEDEYSEQAKIMRNTIRILAPIPKDFLVKTTIQDVVNVITSWDWIDKAAEYTIPVTDASGQVIYANSNHVILEVFTVRVSAIHFRD